MEVIVEDGHDPAGTMVSARFSVKGKRAHGQQRKQKTWQAGRVIYARSDFGSVTWQDRGRNGQKKKKAKGSARYREEKKGGKGKQRKIWVKKEKATSIALSKKKVDDDGWANRCGTAKISKSA